MSKRSPASHGAFFDEHLRVGLRVLDVGCGPGSITQGIALRVAPAEVIGVDFVAIAGSAEQCRTRIGEYRRAGVDMPVIAIPHGATREIFTKTLEALASG